MKAEELRSKNVAQLKEQLEQLKKEAFNLRFQQASGELKNTSRMQEVRRDVARVRTVMNALLRAETKASAGA